MVVDEDPSNDAITCETVRFVDKHYYIPEDRDRRPYVDVDRGSTVGIVVNVACGASQPTTLEQEPSNR
ncbi:MAG: hypothetical protein ACRDRA_20610 [Pseudonocardiaceae bacterium]